jgi:hypothetical protein
LFCQDERFIEKIQKKSGMNPLQVGRKSNPLEDLIIHLCIKDALTCRNVIEASENLIANQTCGCNLASGADFRPSADQRIALLPLSQEGPTSQLV